VLYYIILLLTGVFGGILAGLLGVGGGLIFTPVLIFLFAGQFADPVPWIIGTSLICTFAASASSVQQHLSSGNEWLRDGLITGLFGLIGTAAGRLVVLSDWYSQREFVIVFSILLIYTAWRFIRSKTVVQIGTDSGEFKPKLPLYQALLIGTAGGFVATLAGVGGGIVMVPVMLLLLGIPYARTISISSAAILLISFWGWLQFALSSPAEPSASGWAVGYVDFATALPLILGALAGANLGVRLAGVIKRRYAEIIFAIMALAVAVRLLWGL
jgi:uncharacterized membrane protein YfcA